MRTSEIINIIKINFLFGIIVVLVLSIITCIGYFIVYKKIIGGSKKINKRQIMIVLKKLLIVTLQFIGLEENRHIIYGSII